MALGVVFLNPRTVARSAKPFVEAVAFNVICWLVSGTPTVWAWLAVLTGPARAFYHWVKHDGLEPIVNRLQRWNQFLPAPNRI